MTRASFLSIPPDVLDRIALQTVHQPAAATSDFASRLRTLSSLLILCRGAHASLSPSNNPYLYGEIFRMLFDVAPVQRRLGTEAVRSATLTYELQRRLTMLKKLKAYLVDKMNDNDNSQPRPEPTVLDLTLLLLMLTENDGKNSQQLRYIFGLSGLADLCGALLSSSTCRYNSGAPEESEALAKIKSLAMAILWINPEGSFEPCSSHIPAESECYISRGIWIRIGREDQCYFGYFRTPSHPIKCKRSGSALSYRTFIFIPYRWTIHIIILRSLSILCILVSQVRWCSLHWRTRDCALSSGMMWLDVGKSLLATNSSRFLIDPLPFSHSRNILFVQTPSTQAIGLPSCIAITCTYEQGHGFRLRSAYKVPSTSSLYELGLVVSSHCHDDHHDPATSGGFENCPR